MQAACLRLRSPAPYRHGVRCTGGCASGATCRAILSSVCADRSAPSDCRKRCRPTRPSRSRRNRRVNRCWRGATMRSSSCCIRAGFDWPSWCRLTNITSMRRAHCRHPPAGLILFLPRPRWSAKAARHGKCRSAPRRVQQFRDGWTRAPRYFAAKNARFS